MTAPIGAAAGAASSGRLRASSWWRARRVAGGARLTSPGSGAVVELGGEAAGTVLGLLRRAQVPLTRDDARAALQGLDDDEAADALQALLAQGALRTWAPAKRNRKVAGRSAVARALNTLLAEGGWSLPPLSTGPARSLPGKRAAVHVVVAAGGVVALGPGACASCVELRLLGTQGQAGVDQEPQRQAWRQQEAVQKGQGRQAPQLTALLGELLLAVEPQPPGDDEVILCGPGRLATRAVVVPHPDCGCRRRPKPTAASIAHVLARGALDPDRSARRALLDPTLGPLVIHEEPGPKGTYPYDAPFVWGSVRLTRLLAGRARSASTYAGIYGKGKDSETCRRMALSEGVERLCAMSAQPAGRGTASMTAPTKAGLLALAALYPTSTKQQRARRRSWVPGLDLHSAIAGRARGVPLPFEAVAVRLPPGAYPAALGEEPFYSGCASHLTLQDAVVHATHELLERDAFVVSWYRQRALPKLTWPQAPTELTQTLSTYLRERGFSLELFSLALDVPVPMLLLRATASQAIGCWPKGGTMVFAASSFSAARSLERVLSLCCGQFVSFALHPAPEKDPLDDKRVRALDAQAPGWALMCRLLDPARSAEHAWLDGGPRQAFESLAGEEPKTTDEGFARFSRLLRDVGLGWWCARLTDAHSERAGFEVAKVIVPGLLRLTTARSQVALTSPRLLHPWPDAQCDSPSTTTHPLY